MPGHQLIDKRVDITLDSVALAAAVAKGDPNAALAAIQPAVSRSLTADESNKVAQLAEWLWARKCP
jgi:hypothetical protein